MKNMLHSRLSCILLWVLLCGVAPAQEKPGTAVSGPYAGATISDFKGKVGIQLPGQALISPTRGAVLPPESIVSTDDGRLLLRLSDGSDILVRPHTKLVLKQPETSGWHYLQLMIGRIRSQIQRRLGGSSSFEMGTPSAVISVRGTVFEVEVDRRGDTQVDVEEGVVELGSAEGYGRSVMVTAGFSSRVGMDSGPEVPRPTRDWRPELDRRSRHNNDSGGEDEAIRRLEASSHDRGDSHEGDSGGSSAGSDEGESGSGSGSSSSSGSSSDSGSQSGSGSDDGGDRHRSGGKPPGLL